MAKNFNKKISDNVVRLGEVRFGYVNVFAPRANDDGKEKYSAQIMIPKTNTQAIELLNQAVEAAKEVGKTSKWNGKIPPASKLKLPLRDGDEEFEDDENYKGMWFMNASSAKEQAPGVRVLENGQLAEALDQDDFYSGCWGCVTIGLFPYNTSGNMGVAAGLNNVIKTRDDERLGGGRRSAEQDFDDLADGSGWAD